MMGPTHEQPGIVTLAALGLIILLAPVPLKEVGVAMLLGV